MQLSVFWPENPTERVSNLVITQPPDLSKCHFVMIHKPERWFTMRSDVSVDATVNHLRDRARDIEKGHGWSFRS